MSRNSKAKRDNRRKQKKPKTLNEGKIIHYGKYQDLIEVKRAYDYFLKEILYYLLLFIPILVKEEVDIKEITIKRFISLYLKLYSKKFISCSFISSEFLPYYCELALNSFNDIQTDEDLQEYINKEKDTYLHLYLDDLKNNKTSLDKFSVVYTEIVREEFKKE